MFAAIHINPALEHQIDHGHWFARGFARHGIDCIITPDIEREADIHVISGPWYAKTRWKRHPRTIEIDRCFYRGDLQRHVSIGWCRGDGGRRYCLGSGRKLPEVKPRKRGQRSIFLADYNGPIEPADTIRLHPRNRPQPPLEDQLREHDIAIGYRTTALVTAALEGLRIDCRDDRNILANDNWRELIAYADWHYTEIENGEAWAHLNGN